MGELLEEASLPPMNELFFAGARQSHFLFLTLCAKIFKHSALGSLKLVAV